MIACDSSAGGLFHKTCVGYNEADEIEGERDEWLCPVCNLVVQDGNDNEESHLENEIDPVVVSSNTVKGMKTAIEVALKELSKEAFVHGFESRKEFMKKIIETNGGNTYDMHWRKKKKN